MSTAQAPVSPQLPEDIADLPEKAVHLAAEILNQSRARETGFERTNSARMARMMDDLPGKKFTIAMADQVLRMQKPTRSASRLNSLLSEYGLPRYFGWLDRVLLWSGARLARFLPGFVMPFVKRRVRSDSAHVIISAEPDQFPKYIRQRTDAGIRINFNQLGEAVLGDREADRRLSIYLQRFQEPGIQYASVKLSSIVSQISLIGYEQTLEEVKERLRQVYRAAQQGGGAAGPKFVNLDMEEYRDLYLTVDVFRDVLDEEEFATLPAGIVLQAYLPDSFAVLQELSTWARERKQRSGADIKIRLVKGANLAMEQIEASLEDWPQAPYQTKAESDANYKRMLEYACRPENAAAVRIGIASHNLFDIAYALLLTERRGVRNRVDFEMLEGMANAQAREIRERTGDLLVYSPVCFDAEFESAVAYLVRRFDENTQPGSFLGALFALREGSPEWHEQSQMFLHACQLAHDPALSSSPARVQNRATEQPTPSRSDDPFRNAANTDFSIPANREWIRSVVDTWKDKVVDTIPIQIGGEEMFTEFRREARDPSRPGAPAYEFCRADQALLDRALDTAVAAQSEWEQRGLEGRAEVLRNVAAVFAQQRGDTIGTMLVDAGKAIHESDVEITEAIDFAEYYARSLDADGWHDGTTFQAAGVVVVTPPWNFPYAIPAGGVLAGLMAGNAVILKPASETVLTAWKLANQLWDAGVPRDVLQFLPLKDGETGKSMISDPRVDIVILTGGYATAEMFQSWRPDLRLYAETSGKNSMIITAAADLDLAVKDLVRGAFGHAGQKCSATSLALVQREVYESDKFRNQLKDAAESLIVASAWNMAAEMTPVIKPPSHELEQGIQQLDPGESWLLEPAMVDNNPCLWTPGIRLGVKRGSWYHRTECFGPVLGLIPVDSFAEALEIQNDNEFGLTGGLHSLDPNEIREWRERVEVGNAYINRTTTGAIVQRQPFGGWKNSCVGTGAKAGGPNYVASLGNWNEAALPQTGTTPNPEIQAVVSQANQWVPEREKQEALEAAARSYTFWWNEYFCQEHDPSNLHGETNHFRYRPRKFHVIRVQPGENPLLEITMAVLACRLTGVPLEISSAEPADWHFHLTTMGIPLTVETDEQLAQRLAARDTGTLRIMGEYAATTFAPSVIGNIPIVRSHVLANGRVELLNYLREQSMTEIVHRYGNIV